MIEFDPVLVHGWLERSAQYFPDKNALITSDCRLNYQELNEESNNCSHYLMKRGICRGDRVLIFMENSAEVVIALFAILKAGAIFSILEGSVKTKKLKYIISNADSRLIVAHYSKRTIVREALQDSALNCKILWVGSMGDKIANNENVWEEIKQDAMNKEKRSFPQCIDVDLAALIYTSGSTGEPKGVMSTHHNMVSAARSIIQYIGNKEDDIILNVLPLSFDYGLYQVIMSVMFGGTVVVEKSFMYTEQILQRLKTERITGFPIVPSLLAMLLRLGSLSAHDFSSLRYITNTGAALPVDHIRALRKLFPHVTIFSMFGLTECKRVCFLPPEHIDIHPQSVGVAMPNCEVAVVDETGLPVEPGRTGQLVVRGSNVMQGYWNDPQTTRKFFQEGRYPADSLLYTGDYFHTDEEGYLYFDGRRDDLIKSRGERVSIREVERVLHEMDGMSETAVVAVPDELLGQAIAAFIVPEPGVVLDRAKVLMFCSSHLEVNKIPKHVWFMEKLPRLENGKVDLKLLKSCAAEKTAVES